MKLLHSSSLSQCLVHDELTLAGNCVEHGKQFFFRLSFKSCMTQSIAASLQASDGLLKSFFVGLSDTHNLAYSLHLCA